MDETKSDGLISLFTNNQVIKLHCGDYVALIKMNEEEET